MKNFFTIAGVLLLILLLAAGGTAFWVAGQLSPVDETKTVEVDIAAGSSPRRISALLEESGVIRNGDIFYLYLRYTGEGSDFRAGTYLVETPIENRDLISLLKTGQGHTETVRVTIPEGLKVEEIAARLADAGLGDLEVFLDLATAGEFEYPFLSYPEDDRILYRLEGFLFPDTYEFRRDAGEREVLNRMLDRFSQVYNGEARARAVELGLSDLELVTMASIVEKEARVAAERPRIAGVFYNRLERSMAFQSCATIQYLFPEPKEKLYNSDLEIESPYNTYKYGGLPPGPIGAPGVASLEAALYPEEHNYLYFVAKKDGSHSFNETYEGHLEDKAINEAQ